MVLVFFFLQEWSGRYERYAFLAPSPTEAAQKGSPKKDNNTGFNSISRITAAKEIELIEDDEDDDYTVLSEKEQRELKQDNLSKDAEDILRAIAAEKKAHLVLEKQAAYLNGKPAIIFETE